MSDGAVSCFHKHDMFRNIERRATNEHFIDYDYHDIHFYSNISSFNPIEISIRDNKVKNMCFYPTNRIDDFVRIEFLDDKLICFHKKISFECHVNTVAELYNLIDESNNRFKYSGQICDGFFQKILRLSSIQYVLDEINNNMKTISDITIEI